MNTKLLRSILIVWVLVLSGCVKCEVAKKSADNQGEPKINYILDIYSPIKNTRDSLSFFASDIDFVKLDLTPGCLLDDRVSDLSIADGYIFVAKLGGVYQFESTGKFIRKIGRNGRGPGEYPMVNSMQVDTGKKIVYVFPGKIGDVLLGYNFSGEFVKQINFDLRECTSFDIDKGRFIFHPFGVERFKKDYQKLYVTDSTGNNLYSFPSSIFPQIKKEGRRPVCFGTTRNWSWKHNGNLFFLEEGNDTIFRIENDSLVFAWQLSGSNKLSPEKLYFSKPGTYGGNHVQLVNKGMIPINSCVYETDGFLIFRCKSEGRSYFTIYDKAKDKLYRTNFKYLKGDEEQSECFFDDLVSGLSLNPVFQITDNSLVAILLPHEILAQKDSVLSFYKKHLKDKTKQFIGLCENLKEDDNPVLMIIKMN